MKKSTNRNIKKAVQLQHTKKKLYEMKHEKSHKKINLVKMHNFLVQVSVTKQ